MIDINKYKEEFRKLDITDKDQQLEILNSLLRFALIAQNDNNNQYNIKNNEEE